MAQFDKNIRCRGSLQNHLIDTGGEVILVETSLPVGTPEEHPAESVLAQEEFTTQEVSGKMSAPFAAMYTTRQGTKDHQASSNQSKAGEGNLT